MHTPPLTSDTSLLTEDELLHRKGTVYHHLTYLLRQESTSPYLTYRALCTLYTTFPELALCRTPESECIWESLMSLIYDPEHEDYVRLSALTLMAKLLRKMERHNAKKNKEGGKEEKSDTSDEHPEETHPSVPTQRTHSPTPHTPLSPNPDTPTPLSAQSTNPIAALPHSRARTTPESTETDTPRAHSSIDQPLPTPSRPHFILTPSLPHMTTP